MSYGFPRGSLMLGCCAQKIHAARCNRPALIAHCFQIRRRLPPEGARLGRAQPLPEGQQDHGGILMPVPVCPPSSSGRERLEAPAASLRGSPDSWRARRPSTSAPPPAYHDERSTWASGRYAQRANPPRGLAISILELNQAILQGQRGRGMTEGSPPDQSSPFQGGDAWRFANG
jgi:hypothetical protein